MLSAVILLLTNSLMFTLRLNGSTGSFPKPLSAAEEKQYLERYAAGDLEARNVLIEHNLRLVAHIMKKYYIQMQVKCSPMLYNLLLQMLLLIRLKGMKKHLAHL